MKISQEEIKNIALLSRLEIKDLEAAEKALSNILTYVEELEKLDLTDVEPMAHAVPLQNVYRPDEMKQSLPREAALQNAPEEENGYFRVPRVVQN